MMCKKLTASLALGLFAFNANAAAYYDWTNVLSTAGGTYNWTDPANWTNTNANVSYPNAVGDEADLRGVQVSSGNTAIFDLGGGAITVGTMDIGQNSGNNSIGNYRFQNGSLIMDATSGDTKIIHSAQKGSWYFDTNMTLEDNLDITINRVGAQTTTPNLWINGNISGIGKTLTLNMTGVNGPGTAGYTPLVITLVGTNTYTGNTTINACTLTLASTGSLLMDINNGSSTRLIGGTGGYGYLSLNGRLALDITDVTRSGSWNLVDVTNLNETYHATTFTIGFNGGVNFTETSNVWTYANSFGAWTFTEATGVLDFIANPRGTTIFLR
jgi:fibronectin-binding autotransporter adhesin